MDGKNPPWDIPDMAGILQLRKSLHRGTTLVLGSRAGGLFRSEKLYATLKFFDNTGFGNLPPLKQFGECYHLLTHKNLPGFSQADIDSLLAEALRNVVVSDPDIYLARLVQNGLFDVIITTNIDYTVEEALRSVGMRERYDFEVLNVYAGVKKDGIRIKENVPCHIVKVFGQLTTGEYIIRRSGYLSQYRQIRDLLEEFLTRDCLIMALDPQWDAEIYHAFLLRGNPFWFINNEALDATTSLYQIAETRKAKYFVGPSAHYAHFMPSLYFHFMNEPQPKQIEAPIHHPQKKAVSDQDAHPIPLESPADISSHPLSLENPLEIFLSCDYSDEALVNTLIEHMASLKREKIIHAWYRHNIQAGQISSDEINYHLDSANIILLLISSSFLASDDLYNSELKHAMQLHAAGKAHVIPIILRPSDWQNTSFGDFLPLPSEGKPVTEWENRDAAFLNIVQGIREVIKEIQNTP
jgi:hypothetical protein